MNGKTTHFITGQLIQLDDLSEKDIQELITSITSSMSEHSEIIQLSENVY